MTFLKPEALGPSAEKLKRDLSNSIVGQSNAVDSIIDVYQTYLAGLHNPRAPIGSFLLMGPTGSGKTHTVESLALSLLGSERAYTKIDCAEFQHSHEIAKLVGSPPGYLGHRETHPMLSQEVLNSHQTGDVKLNILLLDEVEKASDALWNLMLGILDKATLTLGDNKKVDFTSTLIFMTSNLGSEEMGKASKGYAFGSHTVLTASEKEKKILAAGKAAMKRKFTPEFINRLDSVVTFQPLTEFDIKEILNLELDRVQDRITKTPTPFLLFVTPRAKALLTVEGYSEEYGARHIKRAIREKLLKPISNMITSGQIIPGCEVEVTVGNGKFVFIRDKKKPQIEKAA